MTNYVRVIPRDLFCEGSLLKCYGRLAILLDQTSGHHARFEEEQVPSFEIAQDPGSGAITVANLTFTVRGTPRLLQRPLNSREAWPLWLEGGPDDPDFEAIPVFDANGDLSEEMLDHIRG